VLPPLSARIAGILGLSSPKRLALPRPMAVRRLGGRLNAASLVALGDHAGCPRSTALF